MVSVSNVEVAKLRQCRLNRLRKGNRPEAVGGAVGSGKVKQGLGRLNLHRCFAQLAVGGMGKQNGFGMKPGSLQVARKKNFSCLDGLLVPTDGAVAVVFERNEPEVAHKRPPGPLLTV